MKKAKKLGLQSLALVLMAFVLVAGVAFGMTGAWFTDRVANEDPITATFGTVVINTNEADVAFYDGATTTALTNPLMPGDHLQFVLPVNNTGEAAYILIHATIAFTNTKNSANAGALDKWYTVNNNEAVEVLNNTVGSLAKTNGTVTLTANLAFDGSIYGNDYQGATVTVTYEVRAIQVKNVSAGDAYTYLKNAAQATFDAGTGALAQSQQG